MANYRDPRIDQDTATELVLYISNDGKMYETITKPEILMVIARKIVTNKYKQDLAIKAFENLIDIGMKRYAKEFGPLTANPATRNEAAKQLLDVYTENITRLANKMNALKKEGKPWSMR